MPPVLDAILGQISVASADLAQYQPREMDWAARARASSERFVPWLIGIAPGLKSFVEDVLNAPLQLRRMWAEIRSEVDLPRERVEVFDRQLSLDDILRESVTGEVVSKVVTKYLLDQEADLRCNGRSDYPDIYLASFDYSGLPQFGRKKAGDVADYGAALKGAERRPVRVPDGLEIKTCRNLIRVDCHHPHAGLHLALIFGEVSRVFTVTDLRVAFLSSADYHESERNTTATTVKYSFNGERFVSLLF